MDTDGNPTCEATIDGVTAAYAHLFDLNMTVSTVADQTEKEATMAKQEELYMAYVAWRSTIRSATEETLRMLKEALRKARLGEASGDAERRGGDDGDNDDAPTPPPPPVMPWTIPAGATEDDAFKWSTHSSWDKNFYSYGWDEDAGWCGENITDTTADNIYGNQFATVGREGFGRNLQARINAYVAENFDPIPCSRGEECSGPTQCTMNTLIFDAGACFFDPANDEQWSEYGIDSAATTANGAKDWIFCLGARVGINECDDGCTKIIMMQYQVLITETNPSGGIEMQAKASMGRPSTPNEYGVYSYYPWSAEASTSACGGVLNEAVLDDLARQTVADFRFWYMKASVAGSSSLTTCSLT